MSMIYDVFDRQRFATCQEWVIIGTGWRVPERQHASTHTLPRVSCVCWRAANFGRAANHIRDTRAANEIRPHQRAGAHAVVFVDVDV